MSTFEERVKAKTVALLEMQRLAGYALSGLADPDKVAARMAELKKQATWIPGEVVSEIFWKNGSKRHEPVEEHRSA